MPDDFRLEFDSSPQPEPKRKARRLDDEDDGREYEVEPAAPAEPPYKLEEPAENINVTWWRHYAQQHGLRSTFTTGEILLVMTMVAVAAAFVRFLPAAMTAGLLGWAVLVSLVLLSREDSPPRFLYLLFWAIVFLYAIVAVVAAVGGNR